MSFIEPISLAGRHALLEPLTEAHHDALIEAVSDGELWKLWYTSAPAPEAMGAWIAAALAMREQEGALPFIIRDARNGRLLGSTRYFHVDANNRRVEIGHTWLAHSAQRTGVNTDAKLQLLTHAFEALGCIAVEFRTHFMNRQSRAAIERLGAKQDGILRNHQRLADGTLRDTVVFSIIESEWPTVKRHLQYLQQR